MNATFKDDALDRLETGEGGDGEYEPGVVKAFRKRIQFIRDATDERDIRAIKSMHFEKMQGDRSHQYSIRLNKQWRLILEFQGEGPGKTVLVVAVEDYHS